MTEDEAKTKWCPAAGLAGQMWGISTMLATTIAINEGDKNTASTIARQEPSSPKCIASDCACWVWDDNIDPCDPTPIGHCGLIK